MIVVWTDKMIKFLSDYYPLNEDYFMAKALRVPVVEVMKKAKKLGLKKGRKSRFMYWK